jgi:methyl-accepting chemotaxis protein
VTGFTVDPRTLNTLAQVLQNLGSDLDTIHDGRGQLHDAVVAGELSVGDFSTQAFDDAGNALESFAGDWSNGIAQLNKESANIATALQQAASAYQQTECQLAQAIAPSPAPPVHQGGHI